MYGYGGNQFGTYGQTMYQPMVQQYQPVQIPQASRPQMQGRTVASADEITVQEVPTDGTMGWFPAQDGSCVWGKRWTPDGSIVTVRYSPDSPTAEPAPDPVAALSARVDEIMEVVEDIRDCMPKSRSRSKSGRVSEDAQ